MPTYEEVLSLAKRLPGDDRARLLVALSAMVATTPINALHAVEVEGTNELITAEEIAESEAALQEYHAGRDPGITAAALKNKTEAQLFSLQDIAALPLAQRYMVLSPYMAATAEDFFAQDPDLTEFADLDGEDWGDDIDYQPSVNPAPSP